jgi:hypothetical protein
MGYQGSGKNPGIVRNPNISVVNLYHGYYPCGITYLQITLLREAVQVIMKTKLLGGPHSPALSAEEEKTA